MNNLALWKRFIASILDKVCIIIIWGLLLNYVAYTPYTASEKLGTYSYLVTIPPSNYDYIDLGSKNRQGVAENNYGVSDGYRALQELDLASMKPETTKDIDIKITLWFILANLIYFLLGELLYGASFFKRIFGGIIVEDDSSVTEKSRLLIRNIAFGIILTLCVLIHFWLNISYLRIAIVFFIVFEFPLFKTRQNGLDKLFGNYLVMRSSLNGQIGFSVNHNVSPQEGNSANIQESVEKHEHSSHEPQSSLSTNNVIEEQLPQNVQDVVLNNSGITTEKKDMPIKQKNKDTKSNKGKNKITTVIMFVFGIVGLFCAHQLVSYFLADYYNPANYYFDYNSYAYIPTKNLQRKQQLSRKQSSYDYESERILASESLGDTVSTQQWLDDNLGNLPSGKYISSYYGTRDDYYYAGDQMVTRHYWERVPRYTTIDYGYGIKDRYQDGWDYKSVPYTDWEPVYKKHYWSYALSSFDISDQVSFFENEDSTYSEYLRNIEAQINANYEFKNHYTKVGGLKAFAYYTSNGLPIKRVIFCANKRAYLLEVKSTFHIDQHSGEIASILNLKDYNVNQKDKNTLIAYFLFFVLCCLIIFVYYNRNRKKDIILNKYSNRLSLCAIAAACINCIIFAVQLYCLFTSYKVNFNAAIVLVLSSFSVLLIDFPLYKYYQKKSLCDYHYDYILPGIIKKYVYNKINSEVNKKLYLTFVGYPMMVLLLIPMGLVILPYIVISLIVSTLAVYISKWTAWIGDSNEKSNSDQINIINYYSVLGVSKTSNQNDINIAYNAIMAKLNMSLNTSSFDPAYFAQVQEAFFILGDSENARKIYDEEFMSFESCTNPATYIIKNVVLLDMIRNYRQNNKTIPQKTKVNNFFNRMFFIIIVSLFIIITIVKCSSDSN